MTSFLPTVLAPGAYIDPISLMDLGSVYDINNPMMRGNNSFNWNIDLGKYVPQELTEDQMDAWDVAVAPDYRTDAYRDPVAPEDYEPSVEPVGEKPEAHDPGFHWIVAQDLRRGDLFVNPYRGRKLFPVNTRIEGSDTPTSKSSTSTCTIPICPTWNGNPT